MDTRKPGLPFTRLMNSKRPASFSLRWMVSRSKKALKDFGSMRSPVTCAKVAM